MKILEEELAKLAGTKLVVVCAGNPLRGDDGFGPAVAARIPGERVFDAGPVPEDVLPTVARLAPEVVLFVDAADFGSPPGTLRLFGAEELAASDVSTHAASLATSAEFVKQSCGARTMLLAAQARKTGLGAAMSVEVVKAVLEAARLLKTIL